MFRSLSMSLISRGVLAVAAAVIAGVARPGGAVLALVLLLWVPTVTGAARRAVPARDSWLVRGDDAR